MKVETLATLCSVLRNESFTAAADEVGLTPSAVSLQMKHVEEYFGRPLFDRSGRTMRVTPFARQLAEGLAGALATIDGFRRPRERAISGTLQLGAIPTVQTSALPVAMRLLRVAHPALRLRLTLDVSAPLQHAVSAGRIDVAVVIRPKRGGSTRLHWHDLATEPFVLVAPVDTEGRSARQLLQTLPWIRYDVALTGGRIAAQHVRRLCPGVRHAFEVASTEAIVAMVSQGLGVSVIPRPRVSLRACYAVREVPFGGSVPTRQIALLCRRSDVEDRRLQALREAFEAAYAQA
ncbi:MAG: LysR family transcriptional regulator [Lautropia sp.]